MPKIIDHTGKVFNRLTVLRRDGKIGALSAYLCQCSCGAVTRVASGNLVSNKVKSCGCLNLERIRSQDGLSNTPTYVSWNMMVRRCSVPSASDYPDYGGRGISVCERWKDFKSFLEDMGERPEGQTIERKDVDGDYEPGNCRWATCIEQSNNKRTNRTLTVDGRTQTIAEWGRERGLHPKTIRQRLLLGWSDEEAVSRPAGNNVRDASTRSYSGKNRLITANGITKTIKEWAIELGVSPATINSRISSKGWSEERAVTAPPNMAYRRNA